MNSIFTKTKLSHFQNKVYTCLFDNEKHYRFNRLNHKITEFKADFDNSWILVEWLKWKHMKQLRDNKHQKYINEDLLSKKIVEVSFFLNFDQDQLEICYTYNLLFSFEETCVNPMVN